MSAEAAGVATPRLDASLYNAYVGALKVHSIEIVRVYAERLTDGEPNEVKFDTSLGFARHELSVNYRYGVTARLIDNADNDVARVEVAIVLATSSNSTADEAVVAQFAGTSGAMMAFPFLREVIATTAQRIGFPGVMMPIIRTQPAENTDDATNC